MLDLVAGDNQIVGDEMVYFKSAMLLTANDILRIFNDKNSQVKRFELLVAENEKIYSEKKTLQEELKEALA